MFIFLLYFQGPRSEVKSAASVSGEKGGGAGDKGGAGGDKGGQGVRRGEEEGVVGPGGGQVGGSRKQLDLEEMVSITDIRRDRHALMQKPSTISMSN